MTVDELEVLIHLHGGIDIARAMLNDQQRDELISGRRFAKRVLYLGNSAEARRKYIRIIAEQVIEIMQRGGVVIMSHESYTVCKACWTPDAVEAYAALYERSPVCLLTGNEVIEMRAMLRMIPRDMDTAEYKRWRNAKIADILNTKENT